MYLINPFPSSNRAMGKKKKKKTVEGALFCVQLKMPFPQMSSSINGTGGGTNWCNLKRPLQREGRKFGFRGWPSEAFWSLSVQPVHCGGLHYVSHYAKVTVDVCIPSCRALCVCVCVCVCVHVFSKFTEAREGRKQEAASCCRPSELDVWMYRLCTRVDAGQWTCSFFF